MDHRRSGELPPSQRPAMRWHRWTELLPQASSSRGARLIDSDLAADFYNLRSKPDFRRAWGALPTETWWAGAKSVWRSISENHADDVLLARPALVSFRRRFSQLTTAFHWARAPGCSTICCPRDGRQTPSIATRRHRAHCGAAACGSISLR